MRQANGGVQPPGVVIEDDGLNSRELVVIAVASSTLIVSVAVAIAVWKISTGIMWSLIILSVGSAGQMLFVGAGIYQRHRLMGKAAVLEAKGRATAARITAQSRSRGELESP